MFFEIVIIYYLINILNYNLFINIILKIIYRFTYLINYYITIKFWLEIQIY